MEKFLHSCEMHMNTIVHSSLLKVKNEYHVKYQYQLIWEKKYILMIIFLAKSASHTLEFIGCVLHHTDKSHRSMMLCPPLTPTDH